jgi:hypothetical protein
MVGERSTAGSGADDDDVKMILLWHFCPPFLRFPSSPTSWMVIAKQLQVIVSHCPTSTT